MLTAAEYYKKRDAAILKACKQALEKYRNYENMPDQVKIYNEDMQLDHALKFMANWGVEWAKSNQTTLTPNIK